MFVAEHQIDEQSPDEDERIAEQSLAGKSATARSRRNAISISGE